MNVQVGVGMVACAFVFGLVGCSGKSGDPFAPKRPPFLDTSIAKDTSNTSTVNLAKDFADAWELLQKTSSPDNRDAALRAGFNMIDANYYDFREQLYTRRAVSDLTFDLVNLSLSFAAAISGGEQAKTVLASLISAVTGTKLALAQDIYNNKATLAIISQMDALRTQKRADMEGRIGKDLAFYPVTMAIKDLADYYEAGTVASALSTITETASTENKNAQEKLLSVRRKFQRDAAGKSLQSYIRKPGTADVADTDHLDKLKKWMKEKKVLVTVPEFIDTEDFAKERSEAVKELITDVP
jgi:hypothetical protein